MPPRTLRASSGESNLVLDKGVHINSLEGNLGRVRSRLVPRQLTLEAFNFFQCFGEIHILRVNGFGSNVGIYSVLANPRVSPGARLIKGEKSYVIADAVSLDAVIPIPRSTPPE